MNTVQVGSGHGHAVAQQPGRLAHRHRVQAGQQAGQECRGPAAGLAQALGQQAGQFARARAEPGDHQRLPTRHLQGEHVLPDGHRAGEGEADPLGRAVAGDQQAVLVHPQLGGGAGGDPGERLRLAHGPGRRGGTVGPAVVQFGQQLRTHHAEPAQLDAAAVG